MLGELTAGRERTDLRAAAARWLARVEYAVAFASLAGVGLLAAIILSKTFFLGSDSANDYAHVWYLSSQLFHDGRIPLHIANLESGRALALPYAIAPWLVAAPLFALVGERAVTLTMVAGFAMYGIAATRARPALRDPRLLAILYVNTFLLEGLLAFQMAFIWACVFFFLYIEAVDRRRWPLVGALAVLTVTTHPFLGAPAVALYAAYAVIRRPRDAVPIVAALGLAAILVAPFAVYIRTAPAVGETKERDLMGTLRWIARYRGSVLLMPLVVSAFAPAFRQLYLVVFAAMALTFALRIDEKKVNTFGLDRTSQPFYGRFLASPQFDPALRYRVLEPNDREDGAYQLIRGGAVLTQEFFDQSQFRRWWNTPEQYACFLGARRIDVVLLEGDYPLKFSQNEDARLRELAEQGKVRVIYVEPDPREPEKPKFRAYDVRGARQDGARLRDCAL